MKKIFTKFSVLTFFCLFLLNAASAQNVTVKGVVKDDTGVTVPSASVIIKGTTNGVQTDANGNYSIIAPANGTLVFTYIGFVTQEIAINNRTTINVDLKTSANDLQQVVVVGYGTQKKVDVTGSISSVKGADIEKFAVTNPISALQGKVPGMTVVNNGAPGSSPVVRLRGISSTKNANPLYVVDGLLQDNIDFLNPNDIETIDLLRDASSTAIYGLRGANGVIAVTTKRAARGKTTVNFQSTVGIQRVVNTIDVTDAAGFKKLYSAQLANTGSAPFDYTNYTANTNWQNEILRDAFINTNSLSISNNGEKSTTLLSLGYNNQDGVVKYNNYKKFIARLNEEIRITDNIKVGADLTGFHWRNEPTSATLNRSLWAAPIVPIQTDANTYYAMPSFQSGQVPNPVAELNRTRNSAINRGYRFNGSVYAEIKFLKDFTLKSTFYTDLGFNNSRGYTPLPFNFIRLGEGAIPTATTFDNAARTEIRQNTFESRKYQQDHTLSYNKELKGGHRINALVGFTSVFASSTTLSGSRRDTTLNVPFDPKFWYLSDNIINANNPTFNGGGGAEESNVGAFARVSYAYNNKYLLNATIRRDGSSRFAPENRWGTFGSIGLGWVASDEDFFKDNIKGIDFLKLRAAWGRLGNSNGVDANLYQQGLATSVVAVFGNNVYPAITTAYFPDPNLRFEIVQGTDIGLEIKALKNRLSTEITYYNKTTDGILTSLTLPGTTKPTFTNLGKITNKGIEFSLGWNDKIGNDFGYNISGNFSYNKNIVNSVGNATNFQILGNGGINVTETGKSIGYFYGYRQTGIYQTSADIASKGAFADSAPGDISYEDVNHDGVISALDRTYLGTPFPPYSYGLNLSMNYKGFDASIEGQGVAGNMIYTQRRTGNFAQLNYESNRLNAWTGAGTSNIEPILNRNRTNNYLFSTYYLEPGDYFRLRNIQLGYTFAANMMKQIGVQKLRVFVSGQNVKTWTKATGYTPEAQIGDILGGGADNGIYPVPAIYSFGLNVTF
ncbi:SusC/RagA family TonB-linked outer membrane protein [Pedobacter sp. LMG 31464]|uniref:SusC/RagA family TonB-linked outer membrane protein n=1 Tax=Pedobacter planticolens TaxID=2679964 RepID=A0A923DX21_9SPHI|nr:TonB-dependent receptor [Pedobacter planticolens]MBB2145594.1 SusC/RagA family TonB-linked outer membrane protein [Pedobacter planticolens]